MIQSNREETVCFYVLSNGQPMFYNDIPLKLAQDMADSAEDCGDVYAMYNIRQG